MPTTATLSDVIGKTATLASDKLLFTVRIIDAKMAYGNLRYQVTPVSGQGLVWVDASRVKILDHSTPTDAEKRAYEIGRSHERCDAALSVSEQK